MFAGLLSDDARRLYEALLADSATLVPPEAPETPALAELLRHALVFQTPTGRLRAVSPAAALRRLLVARQRELAEANRELADRYAELERLERELPRTAWGTGTAGLELLNGSDETAARLHELVTGARHDCHHLRTHGLGDEPHGWPAHAPELGVRFRTICTPETLPEPTGLAAGQDRPGELRLLPRLPVQLTVADRVALVDVPSTDGGALLVRAPALIDALLDYFELLWRRAVPLHPPASPAPGDSSVVQLQVLRLAAAGLKDEAIARSLGRSTRWVRRHIESLEERLGATNRLTLGIAAARCGLV